MLQIFCADLLENKVVYQKEGDTVKEFFDKDFIKFLQGFRGDLRKFRKMIKNKILIVPSGNSVNKENWDVFQGEYILSSQFCLFKIIKIITGAEPFSKELAG